MHNVCFLQAENQKHFRQKTVQTGPTQSCLHVRDSNWLENVFCSTKSP